MNLLREGKGREMGGKNKKNTRLREVEGG